MSETTEDTRTVEIHKLSDGSWRWNVYCNGEWIGGNTEESKRAAKIAAEQCKCDAIENGTASPDDDLETSITPPQINASIINGELVGMDFINPWTNNPQHFTTDDISENELAWIAGLCFFDPSASQNFELLRAKLKTWDVYIGGDSMTEIMQAHNLTESQCNLILNKNWSTITIIKTIGNETIHLDWNFIP